MSVCHNKPPALAFKRSFALKNNLRASPRSDALRRMLGFCSPHPSSPDAAWDQVLKPGFLYVLFVYTKKTVITTVHNPVAVRKFPQRCLTYHAATCLHFSGNKLQGSRTQAIVFPANSSTGKKKHLPKAVGKEEKERKEKKGKKLPQPICH